MHTILISHHTERRLDRSHMCCLPARKAYELQTRRPTGDCCGGHGSLELWCCLSPASKCCATIPWPILSAWHPVCNTYFGDYSKTHRIDVRSAQEMPSIRFRTPRPPDMDADEAPVLEARSLVSQRIAAELDAVLSGFQAAGLLPQGANVRLTQWSEVKAMCSSACKTAHVH